MPRLPFAEPDPPKRRAPAPPMSVADLCARLKGALADAFPGKVRVVGEVSNFSGHRAGATRGPTSGGPTSGGGGSPSGGGGHWFFSLKDSGATIRCVAFASVAQRVAFPVDNGMAVVATGRIDLYPAQGHVQLYIDKLEPVGQGALELALRQMIDELREAGYFAPEAKRPVPAVPRRVAVVTSRSAAALADVINTAHKRWPGCELLLYDVRVQGAEAAPRVAGAIDRLSQQGERLGIDAIILTRGGGSIEDLWAFNERVVADAIYRCSIPVVAAIGHETDTTVAELVADVRCATPTQAAMTVVPDRAALGHQVDQLAGRMSLMLGRNVQHARQRVEGLVRRPCLARPITIVEQASRRLDALARHPALTRPGRRIEQARQRLAGLDARLRVLPKQRCVHAAQRLDRLARHLDAVGPQQVLARGYTYTLDAKGQPVTRAAAVASGDRLTTVFRDGRVGSTVDGAMAPTEPRPARRRRISPSRPGADEGGLFAPRE